MPHAPPPKRALGQHFLSDPSILRRIVQALDPTARDTVLEIGPGRGTLTAFLAPRAGRLIAIERDADLVPALRERFASASATIVEGDALALDWRDLAGCDAPSLIVGNIPYQITSPLLDKALTPPRPERMVFLVQREVADRLAAAPGTKAYGALTVGVRVVATVERLFSVPAGAFHPPPKVRSAVIRLTPLERPLISDADVAAFRRLVVGLFGFRRKQALRAVRELTGWSPGRVQDALAAAGVPPSTRPGAIAPEAFVLLYGALVDVGWQAG